MTVADRVWETVFWVSLLLPFYSYVLYPALVIPLARLRKSSAKLRPVPAVPNYAPGVAFIVSAYNEEQHVEELVQNLLALDYPGPLTLYLGSDGSSDGTAAILNLHASERVRVFAFAANRGKASVLNDLVAAAEEPILAFTDANTRLDRAALGELVKHFHDPSVGVVCGELLLRSAGGGDNVDGLYWRLERQLKASEDVFGALLGANGGIYAIRRECYVPIRADTVVDDFCIAMTAVAGGRVAVYEPLARATEDIPPRISDEFKRRVRIGIGNYQAFFRHPEYLFRTTIMTRVAYVSHKVLRWFTPHLLVVALVANVLLVGRAPYGLLFVSQLLAYALCLLLYAFSRSASLPRVLRVPVFLATLNLAFFVGFWRYVTGRYSGSWTRTVRA